MKKKRTVWGRIWRILLCVILFPVVFVLLVGMLLCIPSIQRYAFSIAANALRSNYGIEASIGHATVAGLAEIRLEDVLACDAFQGDTLLYVGELYLDSNLRTLRDSVLNVRELHLWDVRADSRDLIPAMGIVGRVDSLLLRSDSTSLVRHTTIIEKLKLSGVDLSLALSPQPKDTTESKPFIWSFDVKDGALRDINVALNPMGLDVNVNSVDIRALADIGRQIYQTDTLAAGGIRLKVGELDLDIPRLNLNANTDLSAMVVNADASALVDDMELKVQGKYNITEMMYNAGIDLCGTFDKYSADAHLAVDGTGFDPFDKNTVMSLKANLDKVRFSSINVDKTILNAKVENSVISGFLDTKASWADTLRQACADGSVRFRAARLKSARPVVSLAAQFDTLAFASDSLNLHTGTLALNASTDNRSTALDLNTKGLSLKANSAMHALDIAPAFQALAKEIKTQVDSFYVNMSDVRAVLPDFNVELNIDPSNPMMGLVREKGFNFARVKANADLSSERGLFANVDASDIALDTLCIHDTKIRISQLGPDRLDCKADLDFRAQHAYPDIKASVLADLGDKVSTASVKATTKISDGVFGVKGIDAGLSADVSAKLTDDCLWADGGVNVYNLIFQDKHFGDRKIRFNMTAPEDNTFDLLAKTDSIPLSLLDQFVSVDGLKLDGDICARFRASGTKENHKLSGNVTPLGVTADYSPFDVHISLGNKPIILDNTDVILDHFPIYSVDSTVLALNGKMDLKSMHIDLNADSDCFKPSKMENISNINVLGNVATSIHAHVSGTPDKLNATGKVGLLPETVVKYNIDKKNFVQAKASGDIAFDYLTGKDIQLKGKVNVDGGKIQYSPSLYPLEPFDIQPGSYVAFNGPVKSMDMNITATQKTKAAVGDIGDRTRQVDFIVGVQAKNGLDNLGLDFTLKAPDNADIQQEIDRFTTEERNRVAAALLATGMYISDTNTAMSEDGYAFTSIMQHSLNALAKNKLGKFVEIDVGMGKRNDGTQTSDYTMAVSKSFFSDRLKLTVGGRYSNNADKEAQNRNQAGIDNVSAEWQIKKDQPTSLILFHKKDYQNIMEGELNKEGIGVKTSFDLGKKDPLSLDLQGNVSYRSNDQLGPDLSATLSKSKLFHKNAVLSTTLNGAYYWKLGQRQKGQALSTDTFQIGLDNALTFPEIIFFGASKKKGNYRSASTTFRMGYLFDNVAGNYTRNKISGSVDYAFQKTKHITHMFSPFQVSGVSTTVYDGYWKNLDFHSLVRDILADEFIPSMEYRFLFDNYSDPGRRFATRVEASFKEAGNLIGGIQSLFGRNFNELGKKFIFDSYDQFVRGQVELRNRISIGEKSAIATRAIVGGILPIGNSDDPPQSELFYVGGPNSLRAFKPRSIGPGGYRDEDMDLYMYHAGEVKVELNAEYRFPIAWLLEGAVFVDAGNVWYNKNTRDQYSPEEMKEMEELLGMSLGIDYDDGILARTFLDQMALGTGFGIRLVYQSIVIRLDTGIAIHAPYNTGKHTYYNIPKFFDGVRLNFGIGYPF